MRIAHVEMVTHDVDGTVNFYTAVLGFKMKLTQRIHLSSLGVPIDIGYLQGGESAVELISYEDGAIAPAPAGEQLGYRMMTIEVEDVNKAVAYLRAKGGENSWESRAFDNRYAGAEMRDPNGYRIELRQWF
ncbi:MAG TPA: VOC family protein [Alphaproteobacteria bacterium]|nr:VOC family protein [Alphaproteobacteria bacterium]